MKSNNITLLSAVDCDIRRRIYRTDGIDTIKAGSFDRESGVYSSGVYRPKEEWKKSNSHEIENLITSQFESLRNQMVVFEIKDEFVARFHQLDLLGLPTTAEIREQRSEILKAELLPSIKDYLEQEIVESFELDGVAIGTTQTGQPSTTYDSKFKGYRGLHIDNWCDSGNSLETRNFDATRIIINMGLEARDISFINLTLSQIVDALLYLGIDAESLTNRHNLSPLVEMFMGLYPECPVFHVEQYPGEGCIIPVCNMIHDGLPLYKHHEDTNIQISSQNFKLNKKLVERFAKRA
ncbi:MAG: hypothetical protein EOP04_14915 [Proteobacteria bacterium]|nr:MAG: hypothetical protein EOP04_14915 [Pseudomonadota bacterium]